MLTVEDAQLRAVGRLVAAAPTDLRRNIRQYTRSELRPAWAGEIRERIGTAPNPRRANAVIAKPSRVNVTDRQIVAEVTSTRKATRGGLVPAAHGRAVEFGSNGQRTGSYTSRRNGKSYRITNRHTNRQLLPRRARGSVFFPAAEEMIPRAISLWMQTTKRTIGDALEGRR